MKPSEQPGAASVQHRQAGGSESPDSLWRAEKEAPRRRRLPGWVAAIGGLGLIAVVAVNIRSPSGGEQPSAGSGQALPSPAAVAVKPAPRLLIAFSDRSRARDFTVATTSGKQFALSGAGDRIVVLNFLSPGCESCKEEVDALKAVHQQLGPRGAEVLLLDMGGLSNEEIRDYYRKHLEGGDHLYARDVDSAVARAYEVLSLGTTIVIDRQGRVAYRDEFLTLDSELLAVVDEALGET